VREAIGPDIKLMCDINQRWRVEQAIDIGCRVEDAGVGLFWLEDVTTADDYPGLAQVAAALALFWPIGPG
jgi:L-alanine-DL-glutamate epimerase-like enolase superfamily enzyme